MPDSYEFRIAGTVSSELLSTFSPSSVWTSSRETVFVRQIHDDGELFGVIARCETLRLRILGLRRVRSTR